MENQILVYADANCLLFIDFDVLKTKSMGIILYCITKNIISNNYLDKVNIILIMFLLQQLWDAETRYWPLKLEIIVLIWGLSKVEYIIRNNKKLFMVIYTNYDSFIQISKKSDFTTITNIAKLNLKLILATEFIFIFFSNIKYKTGKNNIIPNVLLSSFLYIKYKTNNKKTVIFCLFI